MPVPASRWGGVRLTFHASLGLMQSAFAVATIWQAHHGGPGMAEIAIARPEHVLVARPQHQVTVRVMAPAARDFIASLSAGWSLAEAVEQVAAEHSDFDLSTQLQGLLGLGIITGRSI